MKRTVSSRQALGGLVGFDQRLEPVLVLVDVDPADLIDGLLYGRHLTPPQRFQGPRGLSVGYGVCSGATAPAFMRRGPVSSPLDRDLRELFPNIQKTVDFGFGGRRPDADADRAAREFRLARPWRPAHARARPCRTSRPSRTTPRRRRDRSAITSVSALAPGTANSVVLGSRAAVAPKMTASGVAARRPASSRSRSAAMLPHLGGELAVTAAAAAPKPAMPATFSVPARRRAPGRRRGSADRRK